PPQRRSRRDPDTSDGTTSNPSLILLKEAVRHGMDVRILHRTHADAVDSWTDFPGCPKRGMDARTSFMRSARIGQAGVRSPGRRLGACNYYRNAYLKPIEEEADCPSLRWTA